MGADGAERAAAETAAVYVDGVLYHLEGRNGATLLIFRMRQSHIRQVEACVDLLGRHRRLGRIDNDVAVTVPLHQRGALYLVAFLLNDMIVLSLFSLVLLALLK